jgi:N-hydroxyarylamine O-acetyltransferase
MNTLAGVVRHHACAIPFENLDAFTGRRVSLEPTEVERKLVPGGRGGWCFEQNLLLGDALRAMGFEVTDLAGRVLWNRPPEAVTARTHRLLCVTVAGEKWLVDVGFGGHTIPQPLQLTVDSIQQTTHESFRITRCAGDYLVQSLIRETWLPLFRFDLQPQLPIDFEAANYQLAHDPASHFTQVVIASRVADDGRHVLRGCELAFHGLGGGTQREVLEGPDAVIAALGGVLGIELDQPMADRLRLRLDQLP